MIVAWPPAPMCVAVMRFVLLFALTSLLGACAVGPDYETPGLSLPDRWLGASAEVAKRPDMAAWWHSFDDPILTKLIERAIDGNLDVAAAKARIRQARATRAENTASLFPSVTGSASETRSQTAATTLAGFAAPATTSTLFEPGFDATWELDLFGANSRTVEAARYGAEAADEDLRSTLLTLVADVARYYLDARGSQARIAIAARNAAAQQQTVNLTDKQFAAGTGNGADLAKAKGQALATEANIPALNISYRQTVNRLGVLLGLGPDAVVDLMARTRPLPVPRTSVATGIPADVVRSRPDVRKAERQLAQATAQIGEAEAQLYPSLTLSGSLGASAANLGDLAKPQFGTWSLGPSVSVPLFDAGARSAAVAARQAIRDQYFIAYKSAVQTAMEDVENALVALSQQRVEGQRLARSAENYAEAFRIATALYQQGSSSFLDVLDAERSLYSAQDTLKQSQITLSEDYVALFKALGGGWQGSIDSSRPEVVDQNMGPHLRRQ